MTKSKFQQERERLLALTFEINGEDKELRDCTADEIRIVLGQVADSVEGQATELRGVVHNDPGIDVSDLVEWVNPLDGDIKTLVGIAMYRDALGQNRSGTGGPPTKAKRHYNRLSQADVDARSR